jgi:hypothetical protein
MPQIFLLDALCISYFYRLHMYVISYIPLTIVYICEYKYVPHVALCGLSE